MKKLLAVLLAVVLCISVCAVSVIAADTEVELSVSADKTTVGRGDTITVVVNMSKNTKGISAMMIDVAYDEDVLQIATNGPVKQIKKENFYTTDPTYGFEIQKVDADNTTGNPLVFGWAYTCAADYADFYQDFKGSAKLVTITFKVKDDAAFGTSAITVDYNTKGYPSSFDGTRRVVSDQPATLNITVACLDHNYTEKIQDANHLKAEAQNCSEHNVYWYNCSLCDANAKNDANATDKYYSSAEVGDHSFTEKIADDAHLVAGTGADCQDAKEYYYDCAYCDEISTTTWVSTTCGSHSFTEQITDDAHLVAGTGTNCQDVKEYYYDCTLCDQIGTTSWVSTSYGDHSFTEKITDDAHLVAGTGADCQDAKKYYYDCAYCDEISTTTWVSTTCGSHSFTEQITDDAHLVAGTGTNCQDVKEYYYDCTLCDQIGTTSWVSTSYGDHSFTEKITDDAHLVAGTGANCQDAKKYYYDCAYCNEIDTTTWVSTTYGGHQFNTAEWGYKDKAAGHAHKCNFCDEHDAVQPHTPNMAAPTEDDDKICSECLMVLEPSTGHLCQNHLTPVVKLKATCTTDGYKAHYECSCGKYFEDAAALVEITNINTWKTGAGKLAALGHDYDDGVVTSKPSCDGEGVKTFTCQNDSTHTYTEPVAATGHDYGEWHHADDTKKPTCTKDGELQRICANNDTHIETMLDPALGHTPDPDSWTVTKKPTLDEEGHRTGGKCSVCGGNLPDEDMPKLTNALEGDKIYAVDEEMNEIEVDIKIESGDDEPFSGYVEAMVKKAIGTEDLDKVDGKTILEGYLVKLLDTDTFEDLGDKPVKVTLKLTEDLLAKYENLGVYYRVIDANTNEMSFVKLEGAEIVDGVLTLSATADELAELVFAVAGTEIVVEPPVNEGEEDKTPVSPETSDSATAIAFAIVMLAVAAGVLVVFGKKARA